MDTRRIVIEWERVMASRRKGLPTVA